MYKVKINGEAGNFFTDQDPSIHPPTGKGHFVTVKRADWPDSYQPSARVPKQRIADARACFAEGRTLTMRIRWDAVDYAVQIPD